jgi:hypothetical protein
LYTLQVYLLCTLFASAYDDKQKQKRTDIVNRPLFSEPDVKLSNSSPGTSTSSEGAEPSSKGAELSKGVEPSRASKAMAIKKKLGLPFSAKRVDPFDPIGTGSRTDGESRKRNYLGIRKTSGDHLGIRRKSAESTISVSADLSESISVESANCISADSVISVSPESDDVACTNATNLEVARSRTESDGGAVDVATSSNSETCSTSDVVSPESLHCDTVTSSPVIDHIKSIGKDADSVAMTTLHPSIATVSVVMPRAISRLVAAYSDSEDSDAGGT